jgi:hypothetical protein
MRDCRRKLEQIMKQLTKCGLFLALALCSGLSLSANASPINIAFAPNGQPAQFDVDKGLLGNNSPQTNFDFLLQEISLYNNYNSASLPTPTFGSLMDSASNTANVTGYDYAILHYGKGPGGTGQGGGVEFFYLNGMTGNFTFAANGLGTNGNGGFSSLRLFGLVNGNGSSVPDGGTTAVLFAIAVGGLLVVQRRTMTSSKS